jgi:hypothetical protein
MSALERLKGAIMESASAWVQKAVYQMIINSTELNNIIGGRVVDDIPNGLMMPYIHISDITETPSNTLNTKIRDLTCTLNIWSVYGGNKEVYTIMGILVDMFEYKHNSLNTASGVSNNYTCFYSAYEYSQIITQGTTESFKHGILRFRIRIEAKH